MPVQLIINQAGPLPISATFNALGDEPVYLEVNGSVWTQSTDTMIGIGIKLDGQAIGSAQIWSNMIATHRAVVPAYIQLQLGQGQHTLNLFQNNNATLSDVNDVYTAVIHY